MITARVISPVLAMAMLCMNALASQNRSGEIHFLAYPLEKVAASSINWKQHFGSRKVEPHNIYSLMTQGGFLSPTADKIQESIDSWLQKHPKAEAIIVYKLQPVMADMPDSTMKCVWVVAGNDNLNVYLVSIGALPAATLLLNPGDDTPISRQEYKSYLKLVVDAEGLAKKEKLGIWSSKSQQRTL